MVHDWHGRRVVVTGGDGFLGSRIVAVLRSAGADVTVRSRTTGHDLRDVDRATAAFADARAEIVFNCAANQGGIAYQRLYPGQILYDNLLMSANTIEGARRAGVTKYVNAVAGCAYPADPPGGVLREHELEAGPMHESVDNYGEAKRAAVHLARQYRRQYGLDAISLLLINLYGPGEHFHPDRSHGLAALLRKFYEAARDGAPEVTLWGTGQAVREWLYVDDAADGLVRAAERYSDPLPLNIAVGRGHTMAELAGIIAEMVGYRGRIAYDTSKSDGALLKVADTTRMRRTLDWEPPTSLRDGISRLLRWFADNYERATSELLEPAVPA